MGHRVPAISNRLGIVKGFEQNWYSDLHFNLLLQKDMTLAKYTKFLIHRYYKHKVRFLRGKHRRRRATLRVANILSKRFYDKDILSIFNYRQRNKKYSMFVRLYKRKKIKKPNLHNKNFN
jgi:hypothetical protein